MRPEVVETAAAEGVKLIVSVDTGIRAAEVVRRAGELGVDAIVTDHHLPETDLPPALAVLNPNRADCRIRRRTCAAPGWRSSWRKRCWPRCHGRRRRCGGCASRF